VYVLVAGLSPWWDEFDSRLVTLACCDEHNWCSPAVFIITLHEQQFTAINTTLFLIK